MRAYAMTLPAFGAPAIGLANDPKCVEIIAAGLDDDERPRRNALPSKSKRRFKRKKRSMMR